MSNPNTLSARPPRVFMSYSHDSKEHKTWVRSLAEYLVRGGVEVILDQWDLTLGSDLPSFMESAVSTSDRVLAICTTSYVSKANEGRGGVGYEKMIATAEVLEKVGTDKFIPIVRGTHRPAVPLYLSSRMRIDFSDEDTFDDRLEELLRELHKAPSNPKPSLGRNPFASHVFGPAFYDYLIPIETESVRPIAEARDCALRCFLNLYSLNKRVELALHSDEYVGVVLAKLLQDFGYPDGGHFKLPHNLGSDNFRIYYSLAVETGGDRKLSPTRTLGQEGLRGGEDLCVMFEIVFSGGGKGWNGGRTTKWPMDPQVSAVIELAGRRGSKDVTVPSGFDDRWHVVANGLSRYLAEGAQPVLANPPTYWRVVDGPGRPTNV
jgi:hypothetical protein